MPSDEKFQRAVYRCIEARWDAICRELKDGDAALSRLPEAHRVVLLAEWAMGMVSNGAMQCFYEQAQDPRLFAEAFRSLGFDEMSAAILQGLRKFPDGEPIVNHDERIAWFETFHAYPDEWAGLERPFLDLPDEVYYSVVAAYIREHWDEFKGLGVEAA